MLEDDTGSLVTLRKALRALRAWSLASGETLSSRSYIIISESVLKDFFSIRSDEQGTVSESP